MSTLRLDMTEGTVDAEVTVSGTGFRPNVSYRVQFEHQWLKSGTTTNRGSLMINFKIPAVPYGEQDVTVVSQAAHQLAHATIRVVPHIVRIEPATITVGEMVTIEGTGYGNNEPLLVRFNDHQVTLNPQPRSEAEGTFTIKVAVPEEMVQPGPVRITVLGEQSGASAEGRRRLEVRLTS